MTKENRNASRKKQRLPKNEPVSVYPAEHLAQTIQNPLVLLNCQMAMLKVRLETEPVPQEELIRELEEMQAAAGNISDVVIRLPRQVSQKRLSAG